MIAKYMAAAATILLASGPAATAQTAGSTSGPAVGSPWRRTRPSRRRTLPILRGPNVPRKASPDSDLMASEPWGDDAGPFGLLVRQLAERQRLFANLMCLRSWRGS